MVRTSISLNSSPNPEQGYIALLSVIVISAVLITVTIGLSEQSMTGRSDTVNRELKSQNRLLALGCAEQALLLYALDNNYRGNEVIDSNNVSCTVLSFSDVNDMVKFAVSIELNSLVTAVETVVKTYDLSIISQHEIIN